MNTSIRIIFASLCYITLCYASMEKNTLVPWLGVLFTNADDEMAGEVSLVIMVQALIALAPAIGLANYNPKTLQEKSKIQFENNRTQWDVRILDIIIHPEYYKGHVNTIALVFLQRPEMLIKWKPVKLITNAKMYSQASNLFNIRYKDSLVNGHLVLQQEMEQMTYVNKSTCMEFYLEMGKYSKSRWPSNFICFRAMLNNDKCLADPGMALANYENNEWVLLHDDNLTGDHNNLFHLLKSMASTDDEFRDAVTLTEIFEK